MKKILLFLSFLLMSIGMWGVDVSYKLTINDSDFNTTSYAANNNEKTSYAVCTTDNTKTYEVKWTSYQVMKQSGAMQWQKSKGYIYNSTNLGTINSVTITKSAGTFTTYYGTSLQPSSGSSGTGKGYFKTSVGGATGSTSKMEIIFTISETPTPSYTITAQSNNTTYGTVSLSGSVITGSPKSCCQYASPAYSVTSGTATVSQNGNEFTVTPSSNCTVQINFEAKPKYTISFNNAAGTNPPSIQQSTCDESITLPTSTQISDVCSEMGWTFAGWTTKSSGEITASDLVGDSYTPTNNITLYAVFKKSEGGDEWSKLTSNTLTNGMNIVIVAPDNGKALYQETAGTTYGKYWDFDENDIDDDTKNYINLSNSEEDGEWYLGDNTNGWLYNSSSNDLKFDETNKSSWEITYSNNKFSLTTNSRCLSCRSDLNGDNKYRFRMGGSSCDAGEHEFDIYAKTGSTEYSFNPVCETVHVDTVTLPVDTIRIHINDTYELTPTVLPSNATNKNVLWMSTMPSIATVENGVVTGVAEGLAAAIVVTEDGNKSAACVVIVLGNANIDVVEWNPDWLKIDIENFTAVTAVLEDQNTQADIKQKFANDLFFSKYFEAGGSNKMLGFYNGTKDTLNLKKYTFKTARVSAAAINLGSYGNYQDTLMLPNTEILFVHYDETNSAKDCADDIEGYQNWIEVPNSGTIYNQMNFGGRTSIGLYKNDVLIDIIGVHNNGEPQAIYKPCAYAKIDGLNDDPGFYTYNGDNIKTEEIENDYFLSTNRCMLVRKNTVKDGSNAVSRNTYTGGDNICNDTIALQFKTLSQEWMGYQIGNGKNDDALADSTCVGLAYGGHYDYTDYYVAFDTIYTEKPIPGKEEDGFYKIDIPQLDTLACTNLKITVKDASNDVLEEVVKIPIMIKTNTTTDNTDYFDKKDCDKCDVVVLKDKTLTTHGTKANRDMKLYEGAELVVDNSSTYTLNSLSFRRYNDSISSLYMNGGTLNVTDKVYFDLYITPDDWHYIALPASYTISNVKYVNGNTPVYGEDYLVRHYDGKYRAENLKGGWKSTPLDSTFNAGNGFIFGLSDDHKKKEFRFEFNNSIIAAESSNKTVNELHAWGGNKTDEELRPNHKGWNLIGNPFIGHFNAEIFDKIRVDSLVKVIENGKWTGQWELSNTTRGKSLRYAVIPSDAPEDRDAGGYKSVVLDDMKLLPFTCFFVQIGGNDESAKGIEFKASRRSNRIVARNYQEDEDDELFLRVKVDNWKTGCFISNKFSDKYEPGDDLESRYPIYQSIGGYKLLYSAISDSIIEHGVQVTAPKGTLYLDPKVNVNKFEYIYVNYNDSWFDLMHGETVNIESGSFILQAKRKSNNVATGLDAIPTNGVYKFSDGNNIYINRNNTIFNIIGSKVK